jgi:FkbM family methyltransferase
MQTVRNFMQEASKYVEPTKVKRVIEIGARDCQETLTFHRLFEKATIYAFECNPATLPVCRLATRGVRQVRLIEKAVCDVDGRVSFYQIDPEMTRTGAPDGNPGASSLFPSSGKYPIEDYLQRKIQVESTTLFSFLREQGLHHVDLLWLDAQGAELRCLAGLRDRISDISVVHTEVEFLEIYDGQPVFSAVKRFMNDNNFALVAFTSYGDYSADALFVNRAIIRHKLWSSIKDKMLPLWYRVKIRLPFCYYSIDGLRGNERRLLLPKSRPAVEESLR